MSVELLESRLREVLPDGSLKAGEPMSAHTTFHIGGPAELFAEPSDSDQLADIVRIVREEQADMRILGCGSNVLVSDMGLPGVVVHLGERFARIEAQGERLRVLAGATNADVADFALAAGLSGYEFACGIPGSVGGAVYMNAGAYDGQFSDVCIQVTCLAPDGTLVELNAPQAQWGYRHSKMMDEGHVVVEALIALQAGDPDAIRATMDDLTQRRESKQPLELGSAGSTFKRPEGHFAGQLIEQAGMRGFAIGGAQVSEKHCGFVVNTGQATAADVLAVIRAVQEAVLQDSGVHLEPEVRLWGEFSEL